MRKKSSSFWCLNSYLYLIISKNQISECPEWPDTTLKEFGISQLYLQLLFMQILNTWIFTNTPCPWDKAFMRPKLSESSSPRKLADRFWYNSVSKLLFYIKKINCFNFLRCIYCFSKRPVEPNAKFCSECGNNLPSIPNTKMIPPENGQVFKTFIQKFKSHGAPSKNLSF